MSKDHMVKEVYKFWREIQYLILMKQMRFVCNLIQQTSNDNLRIKVLYLGLIKSTKESTELCFYHEGKFKTRYFYKGIFIPHFYSTPKGKKSI